MKTNQHESELVSISVYSWLKAPLLCFLLLGIFAVTPFVSAQSVSLSTSTSSNGYGKGGKPKPTPTPTPGPLDPNWSGGNGNWSASNANPGWDAAFPNSVGAIANFPNTTGGTTIQDVVGGVTVGTISFSGGNANISRTITLTNAITLNQDSGGAGTATISNTNTNTGTTNALILSAGTLTLADDLLVSNTGGSTNATGAIQIKSTIGGSGSVTFSNVSTAVSQTGSIRVDTGTNTFTGSVLIQKGTVTFNNAASFGNSANVITLGQSGQGSAALLSTAGVTVANNIVVASGSGGTLTLGGLGTASSAYSGTFTLNGDVSLTSATTGTSSVTFSNNISGAGGITKVGAGTVTLSGASNSYLGSTTVSAGTLLINSNQTSATGAVAVNNTGSVLGGTGTIGGAVTVNAGANITGATNGTVGTLTLKSTLAFSGASGSLATYLVDLSGATSDKLAITSTLDLSGAFDKIAFTGTANGTSTYVLATYSSETGTFDTVTGLPAGYQLVYGATELDLTPVPEPSTWIAGGLALVAVCYTQRKRFARALQRA